MAQEKKTKPKSNYRFIVSLYGVTEDTVDEARVAFMRAVRKITVAKRPIVARLGVTEDMLISKMDSKDRALEQRAHDLSSFLDSLEDTATSKVSAVMDEEPKAEAGNEKSTE